VPIWYQYSPGGELWVLTRNGTLDRYDLGSSLEDIKKLSTTMADEIHLPSLNTSFPYFYDIPRDDNFKRNPNRLVLVAVLILLMRVVDLLWMLVPAFKEEHRWVWLDVIALLAFGGGWLGLFAWQLSKRPLIPINDPQFESVMEQAHAGH